MSLSGWMLVQPRTATWVQIPGLPFADCVTLIRSLPPLRLYARAWEMGMRTVITLWNFPFSMCWDPSLGHIMMDWTSQPSGKDIQHTQKISMQQGWPSVSGFCLICIHCYCVTDTCVWVPTCHRVLHSFYHHMCSVFVMAGSSDQSYYYYVLFLFYKTGSQVVQAIFNM